MSLPYAGELDQATTFFKSVLLCALTGLIDTIGMLLAVTAHSANVQDREGAEPLLRQTRRLFRKHPPSATFPFR